MASLTSKGSSALEAIADRHGVSVEAASVLLQALVRGQGRQAQFNHPDLGGMGQWSRSGMLMIGDMFNSALKAKVAALCSDVAALLDTQGLMSTSKSNPARHDGPWPADLGQPTSSGSQNDARYAVFPEKRRLAIDVAGKITVYDTGDHRIGGFSQQQGGSSSLRFTSQHGDIDLDDLTMIASAPQGDVAAPPFSEPSPEAKQRQDDSADKPADEHDAIFAKIEKLASLHADGIVSDAEFEGKKADLLARL